VCRSCRQSISRRTYAAAATAQAPIEIPPISQLTPDEPAPTPIPQPKYIVKAGALVSRPPLVTADPDPFETAYYLYQRRLNERLVLPFTQYFYYKRNTPAFEHWRKLKTARGGVATRDIGKYNAYTKESWHDEVLVGDGTAQPQRLLEQLVEEEGRGTEFAGESGLDKTAGLRRTTEADEKKDTKSLDRSLSRTLYLLVKEKTAKGADNWIFPSGSLEAKEGIAEVC
jgi:large subunit ribosomal protein L46